MRAANRNKDKGFVDSITYNVFFDHEIQMYIIRATLTIGNKEWVRAITLESIPQVLEDLNHQVLLLVEKDFLSERSVAGPTKFKIKAREREQEIEKELWDNDL